MSRFIPILVVFSGVAYAADPAPLEIVRRSLQRDTMNFRQSREYAFQRWEETRQLDGQGRVTKTEAATYDVIGIGGELYSKLVARNGKPLEGKEAEEAAQKMDREVRKRQQESPQAREKRLEERRRREEEGRKFLLEIPEAFEFRLAGEQVIDGREVWVLDARPRLEYRPKVKRAAMLKKFKGRLWIDKKEYQWVRVEGETIDTVSFGLVLARLGKGTRVTFEQRPVNGEVWLPHRAWVKADARVALVKAFRVESQVTWSDYRRFQTDSRVVAVEEMSSAAGK